MPGLSSVLRHPVGHTRTEFVVLLTDQQRAYLNECKQCAGVAGRSMSDGEVLYHLLDRLISDDGFPAHSVAGVWSDSNSDSNTRN